MIMSFQEKVSDQAPFAKAIETFDKENRKDHHTIERAGQQVPKELFHAQKVFGWVTRLNSEASESLLLAARCQHLCRWEVPRGTYPMSRPGYLKWRADLKQFHAQKAGEILKGCGYTDDLIQQVQALNLKKHLGKDPDMQTLEDALCLEFLENGLDELVEKTENHKMIGIIRKTWKKMSHQGHAEAQKMVFSEGSKIMIERALAL